MATYMNYCRNLKFEETPNYQFLRRLFKELYHKCCFEHDFIFDWTIQRFRVDLPLQHEEEKIQNADGNSTVPESLKNHLGDKSSDEAQIP
jgi:hypothetical protein